MSRRLRVGVLALQGDVANHLRMLGDEVEVSTVRHPTELAAVDALIIPGGESSVIDKLARRTGLTDPLRQRIADGMPCLGTCAGMIMLADRVLGAVDGQDSFGGLDITVRRNAFGRQVDSFETGLAVAGIAAADDPFPAVFIRAPWVEEVGPHVEVLAEVTVGEVRHPVVVRRRGLMAAAFHPELTGDDRIHRAFVSVALDALPEPS